MDKLDTEVFYQSLLLHLTGLGPWVAPSRGISRMEIPHARSPTGDPGVGLGLEYSGEVVTY